MKVIDAPQGSPAWFDARLGLPTASKFADVAAVLKSGKPAQARATYAYKLVAERLSGAQPQVTTTDMQRGLDQEPDVVAAYAGRTGAELHPVGFCLHDSGMFGASPDALVGVDGLLECKTRASHLFVRDVEEHGPDVVPPEYQAQATGQCLVTGRAWCDVAQWCQPLGVLRVIRWRPTVAQLEAMAQLVFSFCAEVDDMTERMLEHQVEWAVSPFDVAAGEEAQ